MAKQTATPPPETPDEQIVYLDPAHVQAEENSRYGLKPSRVASLAEDIVDKGGVMVPVEVEPLEANKGGFTHRLTAGFYRHAAVSSLNKEGAGLMLPSIVRPLDDPKQRLARQLSENMERENQSPMDKAVAIKKLLDTGVERGEIRRLFKSAGGRKGVTVQPMSNAMLNILVRFLELPKTIQEKIHDGRIGVAAAYELGKVPPDKRQAIVDRAEADRVAQIEKEEKDEEKYLAQEKKFGEAQTAEAEARTEAKKTEEAIAVAEQLVTEKTATLKEIQKQPFLELDEAGKKAVEEKLKAAQADVKAAQKIAKEEKNKLAKVLGKANSAAEVAAAAAKRLEEARKAVKPNKKGKGVSTDEVKKAAKAEGVEGHVALTLSDLRVTLKDMLKDGVPARVMQIAKVMQKCIDGALTTKETIHDLGVITGEIKLAAVPVKK